ncbi:unnamed protein product [Knipowitschia caucasica]
MAPAVCTAQHLSVLIWLLFAQIANLSYQSVSALLVYDRQSLFSIRDQHELFLKQNYGNRSSGGLPPLSPWLCPRTCTAPVLSQGSATGNGEGEVALP